MHPGQQYQQHYPPQPYPPNPPGGGYQPMPSDSSGGGYPPNVHSGGPGMPGFPTPDHGGPAMPGFHVPMPGPAPANDGGGFMPMPGDNSGGGYPPNPYFGGGGPPPAYPPATQYPPYGSGGGNGGYPPCNQMPSSPYQPSPGGGGGYPPSNPYPPSPYRPNGDTPNLPPRHMGSNSQASLPPRRPLRPTGNPSLTPGGGSLTSSSPQVNSLYQQAGQVQQSQLTGRRRALLIGINYIGQTSALKGCINDVHNIKSFLIDCFSFRECDMVILTDDSQDPRSIPTRANLTRAMHWLVSDARPNDSYFFHFSGHGSQVVDTSGDEIDGYDETILPVDYKTAGQITDDEMNDIMVRPLPQGCRLTAIFDSCHSGTALDLPFVYDQYGRLVQNQVAELATQSIMKAGMSYLSGDVLSASKSIFSGLKTAVTGSKIQERQKQLKSSMGDVIMFSGCEDSQTSADTYNYAVGNTGAMSHALISVLRSNHRQTYSQVLTNVRQFLKGKYRQTPQLSSGRLMDMNQVFTM